MIQTEKKIILFHRVNLIVSKCFKLFFFAAADSLTDKIAPFFNKTFKETYLPKTCFAKQIEKIRKKKKNQIEDFVLKRLLYFIVIFLRL